MAGPGFTALFGGGNIYQANPSFLPLVPLTADVTLSWPIEQSFATPNLAEIIEVSASVPGLAIHLTAATQTTTGYTTLFNNIGANTFTVKDVGGNTILTVASGEVWQLYLADNSTANGVFRVFQFGAGVSNANAAALAGAGLVAITTTLNETMVVKPKNVDYVMVGNDRATVIEWTGGVGNVTLPAAATVGTNWFAIIKNNGTGVLTVTPPSGTIDLIASLSFAPDQSAFVITDGANWFTVGFGQQVNSIFDFIQIDLTGATGNVVLSGAQLNRVSYRFTGAITGNVSIIVPNTIQQYWVDNETTGAFTLTVKTLVGTGIFVGQGARNILYCDSTNVVNAVTFGSTGFPNGSAPLPSLFFTSDPSTGLYLPAAGVLGLAAGGVQVAQASTASFKAFGPQAAALVDLTPDSGTFTLTGVGFSGAPPTMPVKWNRVGNNIIMRFDSAGVNAPSNSTSFSFTGVPVYLQPTAGTQQFLVTAIDNSLRVFNANATIGTAVTPGSIVMLLNALANGWTAAGNKGFGATTITYVLN